MVTSAGVQCMHYVIMTAHVCTLPLLLPKFVLLACMLSAQMRPSMAHHSGHGHSFSDQTVACTRGEVHQVGAVASRSLGT